MATPERFDGSEGIDTYRAPLAEVIQLPKREVAAVAPSSTPPIETIGLPNGETKTSTFLVKDGLVRSWLRNSLISKDMAPEEAVRVYRQWNPDPEFSVDTLFI